MTNKEFHCVTLGNPNVGKSTLFNALTGSTQQVGNWSGVTVEKKTGNFIIDDSQVYLIDLPGIYDLLPAGNNCDCSLDEQIAQQYIADHNVDAIVNLVDATNIDRHLYLTIQLLELGVPIIVVLNKIDLAQKQGITIDLDALSLKLGCPVIGICAKDKTDVINVKVAIVSLLHSDSAKHALELAYDTKIEKAILTLKNLDPSLSRGHSLAMLANGLGCGACKNIELRPQVQACTNELLKENQDIELMIAATRYDFVESIHKDAVVNSGKATLSDKIDSITLNPILGVPIFLFAMYLMFFFSITLGNVFIDFFDISFGAIFVDHLGAFMESMHAPSWLVTIIAGGMGKGIQTVATFIPVVASLFLALSFLESSGYMSRAAFVIDGLMSKIGLPGKAFVPMIVGFGCSVPAIMATRSLGSERERIMTGMMAPFMSCSARLPVYALFAAAFFPSYGQNLVFLLYFIGVIAAIGTGFLLKNTILPGVSSSVVMELPDYEIPKAKAVFTRVWSRTKSFLKGAGKTIIIVVTILNFINAIGVDGSFGNEDSENSLLSVMSKKITPIFAPIGINDENWPATVGIITGIFAKEAVVGTLNSLYSDVKEENKLKPLNESLMEALQTIPDNLLGINLGLSMNDVSDVTKVAEEQSVSLTTIKRLQSGFPSLSSAFAYLIFILLYTPCVAAIGTLKSEYGPKWTMFCALWTLSLAYSCATICYQVANFNQNMTKSTLFIVAILCLFTIFYLQLKKIGSKNKSLLNVKVIS